MDLTQGLGGPADKVVEVLTEPLDSAEGAPADMAGVGFGVPGHEGSDAWVECGYAGLAAVWYVFGIAGGWGGDREVVVAVVEGES